MIRSPVIDVAEITSPLRLLDVRDAASFAAGHAPGAVRVPIEDWITAARTAVNIRRRPWTQPSDQTASAQRARMSTR